MCHFITLVAPTHDAEAVRAVLARHGRAASPIDNPPVRKVLRAAERQYLTTRGHCDCGTVLAPRSKPSDGAEKTAKETARMRRRGWSEAKIARALEDMHKADARPSSDGPDTLELWSTLLHDLGDQLHLPYAGLFVRFYSGAVATEVFRASRQELPKAVKWHDALSSIMQDEVTIFPLG